MDRFDIRHSIDNFRRFLETEDPAMKRFDLLQNIDHFRRFLETETDEAVCRTVQHQLADAEAELARIDALNDALSIPEFRIVGSRRQ